LNATRYAFAMVDDGQDGALSFETEERS